MSTAKNQCMGCQAGWPTTTSKFSGRLLHLVYGGYTHEVVSCTRDRYVEATASRLTPRYGGDR